MKITRSAVGRDLFNAIEGVRRDVWRAQKVGEEEQRVLDAAAANVVRTHAVLHDDEFARGMVRALEGMARGGSFFTVLPKNIVVVRQVSAAVRATAERTGNVEQARTVLCGLQAYADRHSSFAYEAALFVERHMSRRVQKQPFSPEETVGILLSGRLDAPIKERTFNQVYAEGRSVGPVEVEAQ